jgi:hypothetical protein
LRSTGQGYPINEEKIKDDIVNTAQHIKKKKYCLYGTGEILSLFGRILTNYDGVRMAAIVAPALSSPVLS